MTLQPNLRFATPLRIVRPYLNRACRIIRDPITIFGLLATIAIWGGAIHQSALDRNKSETELALLAKDMALVAEQTVIDAAQQLDLLLIIFRDQYRKSAGTRHWDTILDSSYATGSILIQFTAINSDGYAVASTVNGFALSNNYLGDREHFKAHVNTTDDNLFISKPLLGRASGKLSIQFTRKFFNHDGTFGGVLVGSLDPEKLFRMSNTAVLGARGGIALIGTDDVFRAGTGVFAHRIGRSYRIPESNKTLPLASLPALNDNLIVEIQVFEHHPRFLATRRLARYPLSVMVAIGSGEISDNALVYGLLALLSTLALFAALGVSAWSRIQLSRTRKERTAIKVQKQVAEAAAKDRSLFMSVMSHEIRTPLNGILGVLDIVKDSQLDEKSRHCIDLANTSGEVLTSLIDDMLLFLQSENETVQLTHKPMSLTELCLGVQTVAADLAETAGNTISVAVSGDASAPVLGDGCRLQQVLVNLVDNANKFTKGGAVALKVEVLESNPLNMLARFSVTDTGRGIPDDKQKDLFKQVRTIDASYKRTADGAGLRLALSDRLVRAMGGEIKLDSAVGIGSCFWFDLRFQLTPNTSVGQEIASGIESEIQVSRPLRILLAEDNATNAFVATEFLTDAGHEVWRAVDGIEAVEQCSDRNYDVILMDISMPKMDGFEATKIIRSQGALNAETPVIALTAHVFGENIKQSNNAPFSKLLNKPIRKKALLSAITSVNASRYAEKGKVISKQPEAGNEVVDLEVLADFIAARSVDRALRTISIFVDELEEKVGQLVEATATRDTLALQMVAHSMLGSGPLLGAAQLVKLSRATEAHYKTQGGFDASGAEALLSVVRMTIVLFNEMHNEATLLKLKRSQGAAA